MAIPLYSARTRGSRVSPVTCARPRVLGVAIDALRRDEAIAFCTDALDAGRPVTIGVVNAAKLVNMRTDALLAESVTSADVVLADGQSVVWASRVLRRPLPERVAGIDLFTDLMAVAERRGDGVYFLGATSDTLAKMLTEVESRYPKLTVAGSHDGYFNLDAEGASIAEDIRSSGAKLLFVGMSSPRKEIFMARFGAATETLIQHGVGGSFDVLAGVTRRAPVLMQRAGLEWVYRLCQEPRRLAPRYAVTNTVFLTLVARARLSRRAQPTSTSRPQPSDGHSPQAGDQSCE